MTVLKWQKLTSLNTLRGTVTGENIFKDIEKALLHHNLKWNLLQCAVTDDSRYLYSQKKKKCLVEQSYKAYETIRC